ncbi:MAG: hypothetical protein Kow0067_04630 [Coriobacteriia bacterium]
MGAMLAVHVTPRAGRTEVVGWRDGELSVRVTAPPDAGRANAAVCALLAKRLGLPKSAVSVVRGQNARHKRVSLEGVSDADLDRAFGARP